MSRSVGAEVEPRGGSAWLWVVGLMAGVLALGPALGPGSLLNLDLLTVPDQPIPSGAWGLGPELPRRVPLYVPVAWIGQVVGGDTAVKALMLAIVAIALVGVARLLSDLPAPLQAGAGAMYALSPYLLTRLEVGHLTLALAAALLPWALPVLLDPGRSGARTLRWSTALGLAGPQGAVLLAVVGGAGLAARRGRRWRVALVAGAVGQLPWLVPGALVWAQGSTLAGAGSFRTQIDGPLGVLSLLSGQGFWQPALQLGWEPDSVTALLGLAVVALAALGWRHMRRSWRAPFGALVVVGAAVAMAGSIPGVQEGWDAMTGTPLGAPLREGQRLLPLMLLPLHLAAAHGAAALSRRVRGIRGDLVVLLPALIALVASMPALWGLGGAARPVQWPDDLVAARREVLDRPGTVAVLPWRLYFDVSWAGGRRLLNPVPLFFGGDVLTSSDPELGAPLQERSDPRESSAAVIVDQVRRGRSSASGWADLGVRWIVLLHEVDWQDYSTALNDPGLRVVVDGPTVTLLEVRPWVGAALDSTGSVVPLDPIVAALARVGTDEAVVVNRPGGWGWRRGGAPARTGATGLLEAPAGAGPLWYPPAMLVLVADVVTLAAFGATFAARRARAGPPLGDGR